MRFEPTAEEMTALANAVAEIPDIQSALCAHHSGLQRPDRAAHQQQIGAGKVVLEVAHELPPELDGIGLFVAGTRAIGIGRVSTGLGCPHLETDPDFLGLMLAFQTSAGARVDLLAINDPAAPTDTVEEFMALLGATADAAGAEIPFGDAGELDLGNLTAAQAALFNGLRRRLGILRATALYVHLARQTARTALSSSAVQPYWTGVVDAGETLGRFTLVPAVAVNAHRTLRPGPRHLSEDWQRRQGEGDIVFALRWIPFLNEETTPLVTLTKAWSEVHAVPVATVTFPRTDPDTRQARLVAMLAAAMGANPGHWVGTHAGEPRHEVPATRFAAGRQLAYALSQKTRGALPDSLMLEFFETGEVGEELARELERRAMQARGEFAAVGSSDVMRG
jgi:hypothetical protein